jgi:hypothetical protein
MYTTTGQAKRLITANGPKKNMRFSVNTPMTVQSLLEFESKAIVSCIG